MEKVSITENLKIFDKYWQSKIVGEFNSQNVKLVKPTLAQLLELSFAEDHTLSDFSE